MKRKSEVSKALKNDEKAMPWSTLTHMERPGKHELLKPDISWDSSSRWAWPQIDCEMSWNDQGNIFYLFVYLFIRPNKL